MGKEEGIGEQEEVLKCSLYSRVPGVVERRLNEVRCDDAFALDQNRSSAVAIVTRTHQDMCRVLGHLYVGEPEKKDLMKTFSLATRQSRITRRYLPLFLFQRSFRVWKSKGNESQLRPAILPAYY